MNTDYDLIIAGGGMTGAGLACALADGNIRIGVIEAIPRGGKTPAGYDDRGIALSVSSMEIFRSMHLWPALADHVTPIENIHVSEKGRFGAVRFSARDQGLDALGYVVIARELGNVLLDRIRQMQGVDFIAPAAVTAVQQYADQITVTVTGENFSNDVSASLLVVADGADSQLGRMLGIETVTDEYGQYALVTNLIAEKGHRNTAWERFTPEGTVALLPSTEERCVAIYVTGSGIDPGSVTATGLLEKIQDRFGKRLGRLQNPGTVQAYPLQKSVPRQQYAERVVLLGNAAHTIHPNGAQGFNLCLRDSMELAALVRPAMNAGHDPGDYRLLQEYFQRRQQDQTRVIRFTDTITGMFYNNSAARQFARQSIMLLVDSIPALKDVVISQATGLSGQQPAVIAERLLR